MPLGTMLTNPSASRRFRQGQTVYNPSKPQGDLWPLPRPALGSVPALGNLNAQDIARLQLQARLGQRANPFGEAAYFTGARQTPPPTIPAVTPVVQPTAQTPMPAAQPPGPAVGSAAPVFPWTGQAQWKGSPQFFGGAPVGPQRLPSGETWWPQVTPGLPGSLANPTMVPGTAPPGLPMWKGSPQFLGSPAGPSPLMPTVHSEITPPVAYTPE